MTVTAPQQAALSPRSEGATLTHASPGKSLDSVAWATSMLDNSILGEGMAIRS